MSTNIDQYKEEVMSNTIEQCKDLVLELSIELRRVRKDIKALRQQHLDREQIVLQNLRNMGLL